MTFAEITFPFAALWERLCHASIEVTVCALIVFVLSKVIRARSPRVVAILWLLVLAKPLLSHTVGVPFPLIQVDLGATDIGTIPVGMVGDVPHSIVRSNAPMLPALVVAAPRARMHVDIGSVVAALWLAGVAIALARVQWDSKRGYRFTRAGRRPNAATLAVVNRIADELSIRRTPDIVVTTKLETPAIVGFLSPVVLIPRWMTAPEHEQLLVWSLRHEFMHWKLGDTLANGLRRIVGAVFFFHPVVWYAGRKWEEFAELACDRALITNVPDGHSYAEALYRLLEASNGRRFAGAQSGLFAVRTQIGKRIAALMSPGLESSLRTRRWRVAVLLAVGVAMFTIGIDHDRAFAGDGREKLNARNVDIELEVESDGHEYYLRADGVFFYKSGAIAGLSPDSFGFLEDRAPKLVKRFEIRGAQRNNIEYRYLENGEEKDFDHVARTWLGKSLSQFSDDARLVKGWRTFAVEPRKSQDFSAPHGMLRGSIDEIIENEISKAQIAETDLDAAIAERISERVAEELAQRLDVRKDSGRVRVDSPMDAIRNQIVSEYRKTVREERMNIDPSVEPEIEKIIDRVTSSVEKIGQ